MLVADTLEELGYGVVQASDGRQALPLLDSTPKIDLLITDDALHVDTARALGADAMTVVRA